MPTEPSLHDKLLRDFGEDLPISGGNGSSRTDPIVIESADPEEVALTQMRALTLIGRATGRIWRSRERRLLGAEWPGIEQCKIETVELTPTEIARTLVNHYFDVSALAPGAWAPLRGGVPFARLRVRFPCELGWLHLSHVRDNEAEAPGLGVTVAYSAPGVEATLFVYDDRSLVPENPHHRRVQQEFDAALGDILATQPDLAAWPEQPSDGRDIMRILKAGPAAELATMLSVTTAHGHFIKQRATWTRDEFVDGMALGWHEAVLSFVGRPRPVH